MPRSIIILVVVLIVVIGGLSVFSGYLYAQNTKLKATNSAVTKSDDDKTEVADEEEDSTAAADDEKDSTTPATESAPLGDRPSSPSDTYKVQPGETMFAIGQKFDVAWTEIALASGITDANKIKAGDSLIIPKNNKVSFTVNKDKATALQKEVDSGKKEFRLSALETAKADCSPVYVLSTDKTFVEKKVDETAGTATITATNGDKKYEIKLTQPVTKGKEGIWAIESIAPVSS